MFSGALPPLGLDAAGLGLAVARAAWLAGLLSSAGALLFGAMETGKDPGFRHRLMRLVLTSLGIALAGWLAWVIGQSASFAGAVAPLSVGRALADGLRETAFGRVAMVQIALLAAAAAMLPLAARTWARWGAAALAMGSVGLEVGHLHAWAMEAGPGLLTGAALLHVLAAAAWLGGLLPLRLLMGGVSAANAAAASRRFSGRATIYVLLLAGTALVQGWELVGGLPGLLGTAYGWTALLKAGLFAALLGFAAQNRFRLTPAFARPDPTPARRALLRNLALETWVGLAVVLASSVMSGLQPAVLVQPVWPFGVQPSLAHIRADPALARGAFVAGAGLLLALGLVVAMRGWRRWPALALLAVAAWFAARPLAPVFVPATPTSFYASPTGFSATSIATGAALYPVHCAGCHAGAMAASLWDRDDGELFWALSHGVDAPSGGRAMPGFAFLDEDARWNLIDFLRARGAGLARHAADGPARPGRAPDFTAECGDGRAVSLPDLRGKLVRLAFQTGAPPARVPDPSGVGVAVVLVRHDDAASSGDACVAGDPSVPAAYALATGLDAAALVGSEVLIDQNGWLREVVPPGGDGAALANTLRRIAGSPVAGDAASAHLHPRG